MGWKEEKYLDSEQNISSKVLHYIADDNRGKWLKADRFTKSLTTHAVNARKNANKIILKGRSTVNCVRFGSIGNVRGLMKECSKRCVAASLDYFAPGVPPIRELLNFRISGTKSHTIHSRPTLQYHLLRILSCIHRMDSSRFRFEPFSSVVVSNVM